ncbi:hypothetical protein MY11210_004834 [Beauveria gryllotalpidicola]
MDMDLLFTVQRLAEIRATTKLPTPSPPPHISLRQRTAERIAAEEARIQREAALGALYPAGPLNARIREAKRMRRDLDRLYTRQQAEDACWAMLDAGWDPSADVEESDSEEDDDEAVERLARRLNARAKRLWRKHEQGIAATTERYVEGFPARWVVGAPTVRRRVARIRESGLGRCARCREQGLRCSMTTMGRGPGVRREERCERCRRMGERCEQEEEEGGGGGGGGGGKGEGKKVMEVVGSEVREVEEWRFALPMKGNEKEEEEGWE